VTVDLALEPDGETEQRRDHQPDREVELERQVDHDGKRTRLARVSVASWNVT
jgi:hypothetical protein